MNNRTTGACGASGETGYEIQESTVYLAQQLEQAAAALAREKA